MTNLRTRALLALAILIIAAGAAQAQSCTVDFETLNFGAVLLGEQRLRVLKVTNTGTASLPLDLPAQPCASVPAFTVITSGHFDVAPGASRTIQIRFAPTEAGGHECLLDLGTNDCPPVTLTGWGQAYSEPQGNHIGLYLDPEAQICQGPLDGANLTVQVRVLAVLPEFTGAGITACEFRLANLPPNGLPPAGHWTATWTTSLVIGEPETGIALAWSEPQPGPIVELGYLVFSSFQQANWIGPDHTVSVAASLQSDGLVVVDDNYIELAVAGGGFTFNCSDPPSCSCFAPLEPLCTLQPASLNFGVVSVGSTSLQYFTIRNQGEGILSGHVSESCAEFSIIAGAGPFSLATGAGHTVYVRFAPESSGPKTCVIDLGTTDCPEMNCTGTGYAGEPICELTPSSLVFSDLPVGAAEVRSFVIRNAGVGLLTGTVSEDCPDFALIAGGGPFSLAANMSRTVTVRFAPSAPGAQTCAIELGSDDCADYPCSGNAHEPVPDCALSVELLDFGDVALGSSVLRSAAVENTGDLALSGVIALADPNFSLVAGGGAFTVAPAAVHNFTVRYTPLAAGQHAAVLTTGLPYCAELPLIGRAHEPAPNCVLEPESLDFGERLLGSYATASFNIANTGDGPLVGEVTLDSEHFHLLAGGGAFTLQPGHGRQVTVRYDPASYGPHAATVALGAAACADVPLSGFARNPAHGADHLGLFLDAAGTLCAGDFPVGVPDTLYVIARVPSFADPGITGAEFRVAGLEALSGVAEVTEEWFYPPLDGNLASGIRFDFGAPVPGDWVALGRLTILPFTDLGHDIVLHMQRSLDGDQLRVNDGAGLGWDVGGGRFTLNCNDPGLCDCLDFESGSCELSATSLDFGTVFYGNTAHRDFSITNVGYAPLGGSLQISGDYFALTLGAGPFLLDPGETLNARASFHPGAMGVYSALITTGLEDCPSISCYGTGTGGGGGTPMLGIYAEEDAILCQLNQEQFQTATVYVFAILPEYFTAITAAEFRIGNLPAAGNGGIISYHWNTSLVIGEAGHGIAMAFNPPVPGPMALLGTIDFFEIQDSWIGEDHRITVCESLDSGNLVLVGTDYVEYWCEPGHLTFNCTGSLPGGCSCTIAMPVVLSDFSLADLGGAALARWRYEGGGDAEFRLEGERDGLSWQVAWQQTAPGQYEAEDHAAALATAGELHYRLFGRLPGESWQLLRSESLAVSGRRFATRLAAAHPNPFNPNVTVPFSLAAAGRARLAVYDVPGRLVRELLNEPRPAGEHAVVWDGRDEAGRAAGTGVYFVRLEAAGLAESQKLVLLR
ncbi:choice-of-anchor D domain-containing protein [bacterium]|nr:choice-of-anchor D domain-containing protein [bacterium]